MSWRPKDWQKIISIKHGAICPKDAVLFEAGADAILEAIKKDFALRLGVDVDGMIFINLKAGWIEIKKEDK